MGRGQRGAVDALSCMISWRVVICWLESAQSGPRAERGVVDGAGRSGCVRAVGLALGPMCLLWGQETWCQPGTTAALHFCSRCGGTDPGHVARAPRVPGLSGGASGGIILTYLLTPLSRSTPRQPYSCRKHTSEGAPCHLPPGAILLRTFPPCIGLHRRLYTD